MLKPGVYETFYGNAAAWDGRILCDLDMMEIVPVEAITSGRARFIRELEAEDKAMIRKATRYSGVG